MEPEIDVFAESIEAALARSLGIRTSHRDARAGLKSLVGSSVGRPGQTFSFGVGALRFGKVGARPHTMFGTMGHQKWTGRTFRACWNPASMSFLL